MAAAGRPDSATVAADAEPATVAADAEPAALAADTRTAAVAADVDHARRLDRRLAGHGGGLKIRLGGLEGRLAGIGRGARHPDARRDRLQLCSTRVAGAGASGAAGSQRGFVHRRVLRRTARAAAR